MILVSGYLQFIPNMFGLIFGLRLAAKRYIDFMKDHKCPCPSRVGLCAASVAVKVIFKGYILYVYSSEENSLAQLNTYITISLTAGLEIIALFILGVSIAHLTKESSKVKGIKSTEHAVEFAVKILAQYSELKASVSPILLVLLTFHVSGWYEFQSDMDLEQKRCLHLVSISSRNFTSGNFLLGLLKLIFETVTDCCLFFLSNFIKFYFEKFQKTPYFMIRRPRVLI